MNELRWGIIGCGDVVERKSGPSIQAAGRSRIVAVMRRDAAKAREYAHRHGVPFWTDRAQEVIDRPEVNIVYVATPPDSHEEYVLAAARAGTPVLVEKPMALNAAQAERMAAACEKAGVPLFISYYQRFQPRVLKLRELIRTGRIGRPVQAFVHLSGKPSPRPLGWWRETPEISGGGLFADVGTHQLDNMIFLLGEVEEARGVASAFDPRSRVEQAVAVCVRFAGGAQCIATGDFLSGREAPRFDVIGTEGVLRYSGSIRLITDAGEERFDPPWEDPQHVGLIRHIEAVLLDGATNEADGRNGAAVERILDCVLPCRRR